MRGTRGLVMTAEDNTGSVGQSSAPTRKDSVQPRSVSACVTTATSPAVMGMARTRLRRGRCQAFWSISSSTSSPSRNRIRTRAITARPCTKPEVGSKSSTSSPPSPRMKPATTNAAVRDRKLRRARPATSAPAISRRPKTATGSSRKSTPAAIGGTGETVAGTPGSDTVGKAGYREQRLRRALARFLSAAAVCAALPAAASAAELPRAQTLSSGWEVRAQAAAPAPPQPPPPFEGQPEGAPAAQPTAAPGGRASQTAAQLVPRDRAERLQHQGGGVGVRRIRAPLPAALQGPAHAPRLPLADPLRERPPRSDRRPQRPPARPQQRPLHAVHLRGARPSPEPHEPAPRGGGQPQGPAPARGLVELGRDRAARSR